MHRRQDWRTAGLELISREHRVAKVETFRLLLSLLFAHDTDIHDPLQFADQQVAAAAGRPLFKRIARIAQRNIRATRRPLPSRYGPRTRHHSGRGDAPGRRRGDGRGLANDQRWSAL